MWSLNEKCNDECCTTVISQNLYLIGSIWPHFPPSGHFSRKNKFNKTIWSSSKLLKPQFKQLGNRTSKVSIMFRSFVHTRSVPVHCHGNNINLAFKHFHMSTTKKMLTQFISRSHTLKIILTCHSIISLYMFYVLILSDHVNQNKKLLHIIFVKTNEQTHDMHLSDSNPTVDSSLRSCKKI